MTSFWRDLRHAFRFLFRLSPGFNHHSVLPFLGIAPTPHLPAHDSIRLRTIPVRILRSGGLSGLQTVVGFRPILQPVFPAYLLPCEQIRQAPGGFAEIAVWSDQAIQSGHAARSASKKVSASAGDFFSRPLALGEFWGDSWGPDKMTSRGCAGVGSKLSYAFWQRNFAGDPSVVGRRLTLMAIRFSDRRHADGLQWHFHWRHL